MSLNSLCLVHLEFEGNLDVNVYVLVVLDLVYRVYTCVLVVFGFIYRVLYPVLVYIFRYSVLILYSIRSNL
jgi:hypothetical protein